MNYQVSTKLFQDERIKSLYSRCGALGYMVFTFTIDKIFANGGKVLISNERFLDEITELCGISSAQVQDYLYECTELGLLEWDSFYARLKDGETLFLDAKTCKSMQKHAK